MAGGTSSGSRQYSPSTSVLFFSRPPATHSAPVPTSPSAARIGERIQPVRCLSRISAARRAASSARRTCDSSALRWSRRASARRFVPLDGAVNADAGAIARTSTNWFAATFETVAWIAPAATSSTPLLGPLAKPRVTVVSSSRVPGEVSVPFTAGGALPGTVTVMSTFPIALVLVPDELPVQLGDVVPHVGGILDAVAERVRDRLIARRTTQRPLPVSAHRVLGKDRLQRTLRVADPEVADLVVVPRERADAEVEVAADEHVGQLLDDVHRGVGVDGCGGHPRLEGERLGRPCVCRRSRRERPPPAASRSADPAVPCTSAGVRSMSPELELLPGDGHVAEQLPRQPAAARPGGAPRPAPAAGCVLRRWRRRW